MNNLVSVIMSTYNEEMEWIKQSLDSILNQTYKNIEFIIVIDNPQNKDLINILNEYQKRDNRIKLIINKQNIGIANSLNKALEICNGKYIARMDADDISYSNRIYSQIDFLEANNIEFLYTPVMYIDEEGNELFNSNLDNYNINAIKKILTITNISVHPTWFCKKEVFEELEGYREIKYAEDYDFSLRALNKGFKIAKLNEVLLKYRIRNTGISQSNIYEQFMIAKIIIMANKKNKLENFESIRDSIDEFLNNISLEDKEKFIKMNKFFSLSIEHLRSKKYGASIVMAIKAITQSHYGIDKYKNLFRVQKIKRIG